MTFFKNIKSAFRKLVSSTPVKMLKTADVGVIGIFAATGIMHALVLSQFEF